MSKLRIIELHLHISRDGVLAAIHEVGWIGARRKQTLLQRRYVEGVGYNATPGEILQAVTDALALQTATTEEPDPSS